MRTPDPAEYAWWLSSRAAGVVAFALVAASVLLATGAPILFLFLLRILPDDARAPVPKRQPS